MPRFRDFLDQNFAKHLVAILVAEVSIAGVAYVLNSVTPALFGADVVVAGNWSTYWQIDGQTGPVSEVHETVQLKQFRNHVWGTANSLSAPAHTYQLDGHLLANMLVLTYRETGPNTFDTGAVVLRVLNGGTVMEGEEVGQDLKQKRDFVHARYRWELTR